MHALLRYIVREEPGGRGDRIKRFSIASEAFGRGQGFDPRSDSIVRAEMTRLRKSLEHYNAPLGAADPIRLTIPKGSYKPQVSTGTTIPATPTGARLKPTSPLKEIGRTTLAAGAFIGICLMIAVTALVWTGQSPPKQAFLLPPLLVIQPHAPNADVRLGQLPQGIQAELAAELLRQVWLTVIHPGSLEEVIPALTSASASRAVYLLELKLSPMVRVFRATTVLKRWPDQAVCWSRNRDSTSPAQYRSNEPARCCDRDCAGCRCTGRRPHDGRDCAH